MANTGSLTDGFQPRRVTRRTTRRMGAQVSLRAGEGAESFGHSRFPSPSFGRWRIECATGLWAWTEELRALCGLEAGEAPQCMEDFLRLVHPEDRRRVRLRLARALEGACAFRADYRLLRPDGQVIHLRSEACLLGEEGGSPVALVGTTQDVTDVRRVESRLKRSTQQLRQKSARLQRINGELEQFAHVLAHDLKGPLRALSTLASWIEDDLRGQLPAEVREHLRLLRERARRMHRLFEALLHYTRAGGSPHVVPTDVGRLVHELAQQVPQHRGVVIDTAPDLPVFRTDREALRQVLAELIANGIDHHGGTTARIQIGAEVREHEIEFVVSDNGPGIAPEHHERVFGMFQTLSAQDRDERVGMGLALVRKLVQGLGGTIGIDSVPGRGTCVRFTWPRRLRRDRISPTLS